MKISGFAFVRNAIKLYYPIEESIRSILPICDEFIIAVGKGEDETRETIAAINDSKIRIIDTEWEDTEIVKQMVLSDQTNIALKECSGDWCFYIQADEVVHEKDLPVIKSRCQELLDDDRVEGLLFNYMHFWGDYGHYHKSHGWYPREIRVIRNRIGAKSVRDAQSFRLEDGQKLAVAPANARIFHYGWVRPPRYMQTKRKDFESVFHGRKKLEEMAKTEPPLFDFGPLESLSKFNIEDHPKVMKHMISRFDWGNLLREKDPPGMIRPRHKHEKMKYRLATVVERATGLDFNVKNWRKLLRI